MQTGDGSVASLSTSQASDGVAQIQDLKHVSTTTQGTDAGLLAQLTSNPFFTAGFGLAGLGAAATIGQRGLRHGAALLRRRLLVDVEINVKDDSYPWFLYWMTLHQREHLGVSARQATSDAAPKKRAGVFETFLQKITPGMRHLAIQTEKVELPNGAIHTHFALIPGPGRHFLRYQNAFIMVNRVREIKSTNLQTGQPWETITLTTLYSQKDVFQTMFQEAHALAAQSVEGNTVIYNQWGNKWEKFGTPRRKRPLESVILDRGIKESIIADIEDFIHSAKWYYDRGIPYRRGYLLHGPPGTGKSSFIQALAGHLNYDIAILNLSERGITDDKLNHLLTVIPPRTMILLEDVDAAFANRRQADAEGYSGANVTFSGLLNALDGVASAEERIVFLTTNHAQRLDEALVRPGRVDMTVRLGDASRYQVEMLWDRFYGGLGGSSDVKLRFCEKLDGLELFNGTTGISTASLQGLFLYNKGNMQGALDAVQHIKVGEKAQPEAASHSNENSAST